MINKMSGSRKISIEFVLYSCILILALAARFALLDRSPLNEREADLALQALNIAREKDTLVSGEPGYVALTAALFFITKSSNFAARFWPALIGSLVVLLPALFRERIGRKTAIILAGFMAVDPFLISQARSAGGSVFALVGLLAGIGFWYIRRPVWSGIAFGLVLLGGVELWPGLIVFVLALVAAPKFFSSEWEVADNQPKFSIKAMAISMAVMVAVISTLFLTHPAGISAMGSSLVEYFKSWGSPTVTPFYAAAGVWLVIQLPALVFAIWGLIIGLKDKDPLSVFCGIWGGLALLVAVINHSRNLIELFWVSIPMLILAAKAFSRIIARIRLPESRLVFYAESAAVIALAVFSFMNLTNLVNSSGLDAENLRNRIIGTLLPLILMAVVSALLAWGWSADSTRKGLVLGISVILLTVWMGSTWKAADLGSRPALEFKSSYGYSTGEQNLMKTLSDLSLWTTSQSNRIDIQIVSVKDTALEWTLRNFENLSIEQRFNPNADSSIVITPVNIMIESENIYRGQPIVWSSKPDFAGMSIQDWGKWALFRQAPQTKTELILWARNDLFP